MRSFVNGIVKGMVLLLLTAFLGVGFMPGAPIHAAAEAGGENAAAETASDDALVVYYFYGKRRCYTCKLLESLAKDTLDKDFEAELAAGEIRWQPTDVSLPENSHFVEDYGLVSQSLVLVKTEDGKRGDWKNLDQIWIKVRDHEAYMNYVADNIRNFMKKGTEEKP